MLAKKIENILNEPQKYNVNCVLVTSYTTIKNI